MACQHFVKVTGTKQQFMPDSDIQMRGERIVFPRPPAGVRVIFLARNPHNPEEELWMLCVDENATGMAEFYAQPNVTQLNYQEMLTLGKQFDANFVPPPIML